VQVLEPQTQPPKVRIFLNSIKRNSVSSESAYLNGLRHFERFLTSTPRRTLPCDIETVILQLQKNQQLSVYELLDQFVTYLLNLNNNLSNTSVTLYITAVRSYLSYHDIDIDSNKFKRKVKMPKHYREDEQPIDVQDIRNLLLKCTNRRLKAYILILASSGLRAVEACALRLRDVDFSTAPTKIHVRREYSKTKTARDVYISNEATTYLQDLIKWKYRDKPQDLDDLAFSVYFKKDAKPSEIYVRLQFEFEKLLKIAGMDQRKDDSKRHKITLHSFRRFTNTVLSDNVSSQYADWFLGHASRSVYYTKKEPERRQIYTIVEKYLTVLDYSLFETRGRNIEAKLSEKEQEIQLLRQRDAMNTDAISALSDQLSHVMKEIELLKEVKT
jgi:integrase